MVQDIVWIDFSVSNLKFTIRENSKSNFQISHYSLLEIEFQGSLKFFISFCSYPGKIFRMGWIYYKNYSARLAFNSSWGSYSGIKISKL